MELEVDRAAGHGVAVAHHGANLRLRVVGAVAFHVIAVVDGAVGPAAPVRVVRSEVVAEFVSHNVQVPAVVVQVVGVARLQVRAESSRVGGEANDVEVGDAACSGVLPAGEQVHHVALDAGEVAVVQPLEAEGVEHGVGVVGDAVVWVSRFPHVDVRGLHIDEGVDAFGVNGVHAGHDGEGPFHGGVTIVAKRAVGVEVDVDGHFHAIGDLVCRRGRRLNAHRHDVAARAVLVYPALEFHRLGRIGEQEQHVLAVHSVADGTQVVLAAAVLDGAHNELFHHYDGAFDSRRNHSVGEQFGAVDLFHKFAFGLRPPNHEGIAEGEEGLQFNRQGLVTEEGEHKGPLVVFVQTHVVKCGLHEAEAHVVDGIDGGDFTGFKRLNFEQRDGFVGLGALGGCLEKAAECQSHHQKQPAVIARC